MGITGSEPAIGPRPGRPLLDRHRHQPCRFVKAAQEEIGDAEHPELRPEMGAWIEAKRAFGVLDREIVLPDPYPEWPAGRPAARETRIERQRLVDQRDLRPDILAEKRQCEGVVNQHIR